MTHTLIKEWKSKGYKHPIITVTEVTINGDVTYFVERYHPQYDGYTTLWMGKNKMKALECGEREAKNFLVGKE